MSSTKSNWKIKFIIFFSMLIIFLGIQITVDNNVIAGEKKEWYQGGTLHQEKMIKWIKSKDDNKLATSGDFIAGLIQDGTLNITVSDMNELKVHAKKLKNCIDTIGKNKKMANQTIVDVAILCMYQFGWKNK